MPLSLPLLCIFAPPPHRVATPLKGDSSIPKVLVSFFFKVIQKKVQKRDHFLLCMVAGVVTPQPKVFCHPNFYHVVTMQKHTFFTKMVGCSVGRKRGKDYGIPQPATRAPLQDGWDVS